ncbi:MAG TPA: hypothetical protein VM348_06780, partial [Brevundimonas sp.]|nr:hypothetical protein [Brevundimonas sp.]
GGPWVSEVARAATGVHDRPWSPAHLRARVRPGGGFDIDWIARSRIDGDRWEGAAGSGDPGRFRVRILAGAATRRAFEVDGDAALYPAGDVAADFPGGPGPDAAVAVAQWGEGYGWGVEARASLG